MIYYQDPNVTIYNGHALDVLAELREESIQCVVTSPPYWGLRKYEGEQEKVWGGNPGCEHEWGDTIIEHQRGILTGSSAQVNNRSAGTNVAKGQFCQKCGAWRGAFGLEPNPQMYVEHSIEFLRAIWRVLRKDGVVFWNIGDSYAGSGQGWAKQPNKQQTNKGAYLSYDERYLYERPPGYISSQQEDGLKPKSLCLIPDRLRIGALEDGWIVRQNIIWSKPNPMPESVRDRPTTSHEYIVMLTKSGRYYWHKEAVQEQGVMVAGDSSGSRQVDTSIHYGMGGGNSGLNKAKERLSAELKEDGCSTRNVRSVWEFPSKPYAKAHFAVFPEELPKRCILAATKESDTLLDPFAGTGTSGVVARKLGRNSILIDISESYCEMAKDSMNLLPIPII